MRQVIMVCFFLTACNSIENIGKVPVFSRQSYNDGPIRVSQQTDENRLVHNAFGPSLWTAGNESLLGDHRAGQAGDILTVVIDINDQPKISNSSGRNRKGSENMGISSLFGIPELKPEVNLESAVDVSGASSFSGAGSVSRNEQVTLRIAATVVERHSNNILRIEGRQEVRINFELRELIVTGYIRAADISRKNEITYDKIAEARISYGGRGHISNAQQPRYGQQVADILLPF